MTLDFVALDVETANAFRGSICQIALVLVRDGAVADTWESLVKPPKGRDHFDADNVAIHGITADAVADKPRFPDLWPGVQQRVGALPVVAHNANFDVTALIEGTSGSGLEPELRFACSLVLSRKRYPEIALHTLDACCAAAGVSLHNHHDALADATACAEITLDMARRLGATSLDELLDASRVCWGLLTRDSYSPCLSTGRDVGLVIPTLF